MKLNPASLALLGAPPAFREALHVGRPSVGQRAAFVRRVGEMLDRRWFTNEGPLVGNLEERLAEYLGARHCVAVCNGTTALLLLIKAMGLRKEVLVPSFTFVATAHALAWGGIDPVFCDIDAESWNLDPAACERAITPETSAILGVHLFGNPCDTSGLGEVARRHSIPLFLDAAHAFGCARQGRKVGGFGVAEAFSFHSTKAFHTFEGGAVVTNDESLAQEVRRLRSFGFRDVDEVVSLGINGRMPEVCAAMGLSNLDVYPELIRHNRSVFEVYETKLSGIPGVRLRVPGRQDGEERNWHYVVLEVDEAELGFGRDQLLLVLQAENVLARRYFYPGAHAMEPYRSQEPEAAARLTATVRAASRVLVLPGGGAVTRAQARRICSILQEASQVPEAVRKAARASTGSGRQHRG